ncbi:hypothetical protein Tcan_05353 [Toxocara canis]|uniref:Uncharacterized protein n=1 Tax=Toxocara canis TaxID=6265 RepID=A0A0B2UYE2_TOXCA|nr:hypothetical protein Tcan_05353 [Toxocara canis]
MLFRLIIFVLNIFASVIHLSLCGLPAAIGPPTTTFPLNGMTPPGAIGPPNRTFPLNGMTSPGAVEPPPKNFSSNITAPSGTIGYSTMSFPSTRIRFTIATEPQITDFSPSNGVGPPGQCNAISVDYHSAVCQQWKIDVLLALHENTPANQLNYISNFLSSLIRFCDKRSTMAFYYPDETDRCPSRCTLGQIITKQSAIVDDLYHLGYAFYMYYFDNTNDMKRMIKRSISNNIQSIIIPTPPEIDKPDCDVAKIFGFFDKYANLVEEPAIDGSYICPSSTIPRRMEVILIATLIPLGCLTVIAIAILIGCRKRKRAKALARLKIISQFTDKAPNCHAPNKLGEQDSRNNRYTDMKTLKRTLGPLPYDIFGEVWLVSNMFSIRGRIGTGIRALKRYTFTLQ